MRCERMKKILCVFMAVALLVVFFTGCTGTTKDEEAAESTLTTATTKATTKATTTATTTAAATEEILPIDTIKVVYCKNAWGNAEPKKGGYILNTLEEMFNFDFEIIVNTGRKIDVMILSGDIPDVFNPGYSEAYQRAAATIPYETLEKYAPDIMKYYKRFTDEIGMNLEGQFARFQLLPGTLQGIPAIWEEGAEPRPIIWRADILDQLGMNVPETLDEVERVFEAYKRNYPDKYSLTASANNLNWQTFTHFLGGSGANILLWTYLKQENEIIFGFTKPEVREVLAILSRWFDAGYIDANIMETTNTGRLEKFLSGENIVVEWDMVTNEQIQQTIPDARVIQGPVPVLRDGIIAVTYVWQPFNGGITMFGRHLENEQDKLNRLIAFENALASDEDIYAVQQWGIRGEHWDMDKDGIKQNLLSTEEYLALGLNYFFPAVVTYNLKRDHLKYPDQKEEDVMKHQEMVKTLLSPERVSWIANPVTGTIFTQQGEDYSALYGHLTSWDVVFELAMEIITGKKPIDAWDEWVENFNNNGGKELTEAVNAQFMRFVN